MKCAEIPCINSEDNAVAEIFKAAVCWSAVWWEIYTQIYKKSFLTRTNQIWSLMLCVMLCYVMCMCYVMCSYIKNEIPHESIKYNFILNPLMHSISFRRLWISIFFLSYSITFFLIAYKWYEIIIDKCFYLLSKKASIRRIFGCLNEGFFKTLWIFHISKQWRANRKFFLSFFPYQRFK